MLRNTSSNQFAAHQTLTVKLVINWMGLYPRLDRCWGRSQEISLDKIPVGSSNFILKNIPFQAAISLFGKDNFKVHGHVRKNHIQLSHYYSKKPIVNI